VVVVVVVVVLVLEWKFTELDANSDRVVESRELEHLSTLVRKLVKPTSCALSFQSRCDLNLDTNLTLHEWNACFDDVTHSAADGSWRQRRRRGGRMQFLPSPQFWAVGLLSGNLLVGKFSSRNAKSEVKPVNLKIGERN